MMGLTMQIEARKAVLIAEMFEDFAKEEQEMLWVNMQMILLLN